MSQRPDRLTLLDAVGRFLEEQVLPGIDDRGLAFRMRIAIWLLEVVGRDVAAATGLEDGEELDLDDELAEAIRNHPPDAAWEAEMLASIKESLAERLAVVRPGFDLGPDVERPWNSD